MKTRKKLWISIVTLSLTTLASSLVAQTQTRERPQGQKHGMMSGDTTDCQKMMSERKEMMSQMKQSQEKLSGLVTKMQQAKGDAKIAAIEEVVSTLVAQRDKMMAQMAEVQPRMMAHMMQHMQMSMSQGGEQPPGSSCPMMQEMMSSPKDDSESGI